MSAFVLGVVLVSAYTVAYLLLVVASDMTVWVFVLVSALDA